MGTSGLCHFFMSGNCRYGERCRNIHGVPPPPLTPPRVPSLELAPIRAWDSVASVVGLAGAVRGVSRVLSRSTRPRGRRRYRRAQRAKQNAKPNSSRLRTLPASPLDRIDPPPPLTPPARSMRSGTAPLLRAAAARAEHRRKCAAEKARNLVVPGGGVSTADPECAIWCGGARSLRAARASAIDAGMERWFRARGPTGAQCVVCMAWFDFAALSIS